MKRMRRMLLCAMAMASLLTSLLFGCTKTPVQEEGPQASPPDSDVGQAADFVPFGEYEGVAYTHIQLLHDRSFIDGKEESADITLLEGGVYMLSGELLDGALHIDTQDDISLILNGASITSKRGAPIVIERANSCTLSLAPGTQNALYDAQSYADKEKAKGALYAQCPLTINGSGALFVKGLMQNGIHVKDSLTLGEAAITVESKKHGITAKDIRILSGEYTIISGGGHKSGAGGKGMKADGIIEIKNGRLSMDCADHALESKESIRIEDGSLHISAGNDGIHGKAHVEILGGDIRIAHCEEGIEGRIVEMREGALYIHAEDDGVNASFGDKKEEDSGIRITISGGVVEIDAHNDALDANGKIEILGGRVFLSGAEEQKGDGAIDFDTSLYIKGGMLAAAGGADMKEVKEENCTQPVLYGNFQGMQSGRLSLLDEKGMELLSYTAPKPFIRVYFSTPDLKIGESYRIETGDAVLWEGTLYSMAQRID